MKRKLNIIMALFILSLTGLIMSQVYWAINAYKANKKKFDGDVDIAMQHAMDDCKKDYFDSIRVVLVRRLSDTSLKIRIDTLHEADTVHKQLLVYFSTKHWGAGTPFHTTNLVYNYYANMVGPNPTVPQVLTEMSFYVPALFHYYFIFLGNKDEEAYPKQFEKFKAYNNTHIFVPEDVMLKLDSGMDNSMSGFPPNFRKADSLKLHAYLNKELHKMRIYTPLQLRFSTKPDTTHTINARHSETNEYSYKYHGFKVFGIIGPEFFARAIFPNPQYAILRGMALVLALSLLLILFFIYCSNYMIDTITQQKKLAELKDDFINNMTHELKTPIATMTVAIEGLQKFNALDDPEKTQRYLQTSRNELVRLNDLVSKVLNIAAFESEKINLVKEEINVNELVQDVIASEKLKTNKEVDISFANKDVKTVIVDRLHFRNVLSNLVDNAIKYSGEQVKIDISCFENGNNAVFSVKDNGMGIPAEHLKQVFDKFHRVPTGNVHNVKGTGLGLSYVKYIVETHGGNISVKSEINAGSEFTFSIPINA
jgi:signal transduction histidine kinase